MTNISNILQKNEFDHEELLKLIELENLEKMKLLFEKANSVRRQYRTDEIRISGMIDISNYCTAECRYCNLGTQYKDIPRYRMNADEIISMGVQVSNSGIKSLILQSGSDDFFDSDMISYIIFSIKKKTNAEIMLNLGLREKEEYKTWKLAGADRYIIRHQIANKEIKGTPEILKDFPSQVRQSELLREVNLNIGVSTIIGLPGQNKEDYLTKLEFMKEINADMAIHTPFIPMPLTPLADNSPGSRLRTLRTIAITRLFLKNIDIPALPMAYITENQKNERGFNLGANLLIADFTPTEYHSEKLFGQCKQYAKHYSQILGYQELQSELSLS